MTDQLPDQMERRFALTFTVLPKAAATCPVLCDAPAGLFFAAASYLSPSHMDVAKALKFFQMK